MKFLQKLTNWYFSKNALPYWGVLTLDCLIVLISGYIGNYLELGGISFAQHLWPITSGNLVCVVLFIIGFRLFHTYTGIIRYSSLIDLQRVGMASLVGSILSFFAGIGVKAIGTETIVIPGILGCLALLVCTSMAMWVERMAVRAMFDTFRTDKAIPVAIYGTKAGGIALANSIRTVKEKQYVLQAFISDGPEMKNVYLMGKRVFLNEAGIAEKLKEIKVRAVLVSPLKSEKLRNNPEMVDELVKAGIKIMMMPVAQEWDEKKDLSYNQLHEVEIEDLLPRDKIEVDMDAIGKMLTGKRVLITGAAGSIGSEMVRQVAAYKPAELILIDQAETPMHDVLSLIHI